MIRLYKLERKGDIGWDQYRGFIVAAGSFSSARKLANEYSGKYDECNWTLIDNVSCRVISKGCIYEKECVVMSDYNAG